MLDMRKVPRNTDRRAEMTFKEEKPLHMPTRFFPKGAEKSYSM